MREKEYMLDNYLIIELDYSYLIRVIILIFFKTSINIWWMIHFYIFCILFETLLYFILLYIEAYF